MIQTDMDGRSPRAVGKIVCVGRNYAAHAREMGAGSPPEPILFLKPSTALWLGGGVLPLPAFSEEVHHEVELVVRLAREAKDLAPEQALASLDAYAVGLDLTARDIQARAKKKGLPWSVAKGFDGAAPLGGLQPLEEGEDLSDREIALRVNGELRQQGTTADMLFPLAELLAHASRCFRLEPGDLLFTGTPEGVGPLRPGDQLEATLEGAPPLRLQIAAS